MPPSPRRRRVSRSSSIRCSRSSPPRRAPTSARRCSASSGRQADQTELSAPACPLRGDRALYRSKRRWCPGWARALPSSWNALRAAIRRSPGARSCASRGCSRPAARRRRGSRAPTRPAKSSRAPWPRSPTRNRWCARIGRILDRKGEVRDDASPRLAGAAPPGPGRPRAALRQARSDRRRAPRAHRRRDDPDARRAPDADGAGRQPRQARRARARAVGDRQEPLFRAARGRRREQHPAERRRRARRRAPAAALRAVARPRGRGCRWCGRSPG
jgi:hypothetical protein